MGLQLKAGGTLGEGMLYVERSADNELPEALLRAEFCYVLAPRQSGKSSLRARTERRLTECSVHCAAIDLTHIGVRVTIDEWYFGLVEMMAEQLALPDPGAFWEEHRRLSPVQRWLRFLRHEVLARIEAQVVVFIDEIDTVLALDLPRDDFFAAIRAIYNLRADDATYERLTFCLLGVASPGDLIQDPQRTPFNIGRGIRLEDFTKQEAAAFLPVLAGSGTDAPALMDAVLYWTDGHPYMTHRLCEALAKEGTVKGKGPDERVEGVVHQLFLERWDDETSLAVTDGYFNASHRQDSERIGAMLELYARLLDQGPVSADRSDLVQMALRLAGLAAERAGEGGTSGIVLQTRSRILATVFNREWVQRRLVGRMTVAAPAEQDLVNPGMRIGVYRLVREIGEGGTGSVFEAMHETIGRRVAIKVLEAQAAADQALASRFMNEARAVNLVQHQSIAQVYDLGLLPGGRPYIVMELLDGLDLGRYVEIERPKLSELLGLIRQIAIAMAATHAYGIVHRDLKPANFMIVRDPAAPNGLWVKVLGFGLASLKSNPLLSTKQIMGNPLYMAPEMCRGTGALSDKTDVYSLGVILYELLAGRPPVVSEGVGEILAKHIYEEPPSRPHGTKMVLVRLVQSMLAKSPDARPTMNQVAATLGMMDIQLGRPNRWGFAVGAACLVVMLLYAVFGVPASFRGFFYPHPADGKMVLIEGGRFLMGTSETEIENTYQWCQSMHMTYCRRELFEREQPGRNVYVTPFLLDSTEVTNSAFAAWLNLQRHRLHVRNDRLVEENDVFLLDLFPSALASGIDYRNDRFEVRPGYEKRPVTQVTWDGALRYCSSQGKLLPTEAQWEFAARGSLGLGRRFPWGNDYPTCAGSVFGRSSEGVCGHLGSGPKDVGTSYQDRTPDGVYDLGGNVSEWVMDLFMEHYPTCPGLCSDPVVEHLPAREELRVLRGGDWAVGAPFCRSAGRSRLMHNIASGNIGFRCAKQAR